MKSFIFTRLLFTIFGFYFLSPLALQADWPTYKHNTSRTGATREKIEFPLSKSWRYQAPEIPRTAWTGAGGRIVEGNLLRDRVKYDDALQVVIADGKVYFGSMVDHQLYCFDLKTGNKVWSFFTGGPIRLSPTYYDGVILFGSDDGYAYCLSAADGELVWKLRCGPQEDFLLARGDMISRWPVRTGVTVADDIAYFGAGIFPHEDIYLYAVEPKTGKIIWKRDNLSESDAGRNDLSPQGHFLTSDDTLFVPSGRSMPYFFDRKTGEQLVKTSTSWRSTGVIGGFRAILAWDEILVGGNLHSMAIRQDNHKIITGYYEGQELTVAGDNAYMVTGKKILKVDRKPYSQMTLKRQDNASKLRNLSYSVYRVKRSDKPADEKEAELKKINDELDSIRKENEEISNRGVLWTNKTELDSSIALSGNAVIVGGKNKVSAFDSETGKEIWNAEVSGEARGLAIVENHLIVSTNLGEIVCFSSESQIDSDQLVNKTEKKSPYPEDEHTKQCKEIAQELLKDTKVRKGFVLVLGTERGQLPYEIAMQSDYKVYCIEPDQEKVDQARDLLTRSGMYGHRVIIHQGDFADIPYSNYFANLIISEAQLLGEYVPVSAELIGRHLKPIGGNMVVRMNDQISEEGLADWWQETGFLNVSELKTEGDYHILTRGALPGAGSWSHLYGDAGNTASSEDEIVQDGLGVLWYGDPGPGKIVNRHEAAVGPLAVNGKLYVQGVDSVMAYDAYNGIQLWEQKNEGALRTGVFNNFHAGNLVASDNSLFVLIHDECIRYDSDTGEILNRYQIPKEINDKKYEWAYIAHHEGRLIGTTTVRKALEEKMKHRGKEVSESTDGIFSIDVETGKVLWVYQGKSISHQTIALGPDRVFFIDSSITSEQRADLLREDKSDLKDLTPEEAKAAEEKMKKLDVRLAVAIDMTSGEVLWKKAVDVTDCSDVGTGGGKLSLIYKDGALVLCGANANGHYWKQFIAGEFSKRRLVVLSSADGYKLWSKDANYRHRPIVIGDKIIAEPWAYDLVSGEQITRKHPLTGEDVPWSLVRPGHHCGMITGSPNMLFFRSGYSGYYDLKADSGTQHFAGHRMGCWINAIPANGLVTIPESSAGCVCLFSIASTVTMEPKKAKRPWAIYSAVGAKTPVKQMRLNLGAPGDRKDARGEVWLAYPRPNPYKTTSLDLALDFQPEFLTNGGFHTQSSQDTEIAGTDSPWLYSSNSRGIKKLTIPLRGKEDSPAEYQLRLHFADLNEAAKEGERVFDVMIQGKVVIENLDILTETKESLAALVREVDGIQVDQALVVELVPKGESATPDQMPLLSAIEVLQTKVLNPVSAK